MDPSLDERIRAELRAAGEVLVITHVRPDGDAIGSLLGLGLALEAAGRQVTMAVAEELPSTLQHLPGVDRLRRQPAAEPAYVIAVDCGERARVGVALEGRGIDLNIDHHAGNDRFARLNLVEPESVSTTAILARHLPRWGLEITPPVASVLLTGLLTDTIGFRTHNVHADDLRLAADLMDRGASLADLYQRALVLRPFASARYWGAGLSRLERSDGLVWASLTLSDRRACGYAGDDDADLVNLVSAIQECPVALVFVEQPGGWIKVSWRARTDGYDVSAVARRFGGGGHPAAAGAEIPGALDDVRAQVIKITREMLGL